MESESQFPMVWMMSESEDGMVYNVSITEKLDIEVTVTNSLTGAKKWLNPVPFIHNKHVKNLQVGVAFHGEQPNVVTLSLRNKALIVYLIDGVETNTSRLGNFLSRETSRFVSCGATNVGGLNCNIQDALKLGLVSGEDASFTDLAHHLLKKRIQLDPAVEAGEWSAWPLTEAQILFTSVKAHVSYLAALSDLKWQRFDEEFALAAAQ